MKSLLAAFLLSCSLLSAQSTAQEVEITSEPHHHLALENAYVRVFQVEVPPHSATLMHRHRHDYIFVALGASNIENDVAGKSPVALQLLDGQTEFAPGNFAHIAKNLADTPFRNVTIEFLQDGKAHQSPPPKWEEERGVTAYHGGTRDILFVKDGVRVSEIDLQPGGVIPSYHHAGPYLLVAVSTLDLRSEVARKGFLPLQLKPGDIKWTAGNYDHMLTNVGKDPAKFITVEFK
jgi:quercetin dioxygenase-like cupin family protein